MEVNGQLHAPTALPQLKKPSVLTVWGAEEGAQNRPWSYGKVKKVKFSPLQALEALRVVRGWGSHIF
jgi:hypothetical protein